MKKLHLRNIIKEILLEEKGYSRFSPGGTTDGLTKANLDKILLRIAKGEDLPGDSEERGNKVLDKADPENVSRILRGEDPVYNEEVDRMQELAGIQSEIRVNQPQLKKFNDYMHILDFFGGELPQSYKQAQAEALRSGYDLTLQEYTVADQNSTFSEIRVNNPNKPNLSIPLLMDINKLVGFDLWTEDEKNIIEDIMGDYIDDNLVQDISSEINGDEVFDDYPIYLEEPSFQDNFNGFINNWSRLPRSIINKLS